MGLGELLLKAPPAAETFKVRRYAPDILLLANLGAVQLNYGYTLDHCKQAVDMIEADPLILHLNALQEAVQPEGDTHFAGLIDKIAAVCRSLPVPVIAKEVGWGISEKAARMLADAEVVAIDVAGAGGTSWSQVEMFRIQDESLARVAAAFRGWGIPTANSIEMVRRAAPNMTVFASGGLRSGVDIAKCIALGANLGGMAGPFLKAAAQSLEDTLQTVAEIQRELQICMFAAGAETPISASKDASYPHGTQVRSMALKEYMQAMQPAIETELQQLINQSIPAEYPELRAMLTYHMGWEGEGAGPEAQGKRIRPLLVLLCAEAAGGNWHSALPAAAAVELLHNFSLIHDDIQDNSPLRRNRPAVWVKWGAARPLMRAMSCLPWPLFHCSAFP